jgi:hypothetical protein
LITGIAHYPSNIRGKKQVRDNQSIIESPVLEEKIKHAKLMGTFMKRMEIRRLLRFAG